MKIELGFKGEFGYIIVDDTTGKILSVFTNHIVAGKSDYKTFDSFNNNRDGTHSSLSEEEGIKRMRNIMQNGNDGDHYFEDN